MGTWTPLTPADGDPSPTSVILGRISGILSYSRRLRFAGRIEGGEGDRISTPLAVA